MNIFFLIIFLFLISCNTDIASSSNQEITYNPEVSIKKIEKNINVEIYDYPSISGFQFDLLQSEGLQVTSLQALGGLSEDYEFYIATSINNLRILGFSLTDITIPPLSQNSNILIQLQINYKGFGELGITDVILSGENGTEIDVDVDAQTISLP